MGSSDTPEIRRGAGAVTVRFVVNPSSLPAGISAPTRFIWVLIGSTRQFPQPFVLQSYQPAILNWVGGTGNPASVTFNFDAGVSATDRDLIQRGIELGRSFFNSAFQHGILAATIVNATVNPSPSGVSANASGHRINVFVSSQGWRNATSLQKQKILVHEFFHVLQEETGWPPYGNSPGAIWLLEGAAEYVGYAAVIDRGLIGIEAVRDCHIYGVTTSSPPALSALEGSAFGSATAAYALSWLAVEKAAQRNLLTLKAFWSASGAWQSRFAAAFGVPWRRSPLDGAWRVAPEQAGERSSNRR